MRVKLNKYSCPPDDRPSLKYGFYCNVSICSGIRLWVYSNNKYIVYIHYMSYIILHYVMCVCGCVWVCCVLLITQVCHFIGICSATPATYQKHFIMSAVCCVCECAFKSFYIHHLHVYYILLYICSEKLTTSI